MTRSAAAPSAWFRPGVAAALAAAALFGASTPIAKGLLTDVGPWMLAGLLYLGSGTGLGLLRLLRHSPGVRLQAGEWPWLIAAVACGGVAAPVLLMVGLTGLPAAQASLLLNAEGVLTALLAWFAFREGFDRRIALGMLAIVAGAVLLSWPAPSASHTPSGPLWPVLAVLGACLFWALDNNLTRKVSHADASWITAVKGSVAGLVNLGIAAAQGNALPQADTVLAAAALGFFAYGLSLTLFVLALRHLGTARTGAYFSTAPFLGAALSIPLLGESPTPRLLGAGALMALGVWLHLSERHDHLHTHEVLEHEHEHLHDEHHPHAHADGPPPNVPHTHRHRHEPLTHAHAHFPDAHHRHSH